MKIPYTNIELGTDLKGIENLDVNQPKRANVKEKIVKRQLTRQRQDIKAWRDATSIGERVETTPDRTELVRLYKDVVLDAHLSSLMQTITYKILNSSWWVTSSDGNINKEATNLLDKLWFREFLTHAIDSLWYGHSLVQLGNIKDDSFENIKLVPRQNVVPEDHIVKKDTFVSQNRFAQKKDTGDSFIDYTKDPFKDWVIPIGKDDDLGLLHKAAPYTIWKKNSIIAWSEYAELFGIDFRVMKTDVRDPDKLTNAKEMMEGMGSAGFAILDMDDEYSSVGQNDQDAFLVFNEFIITLNRELSKLILGQTMTTEDGSSKSQAEVHENTLKDYVGAIKFFLKSIVQKELFPRMVKHGIFPEGSGFMWDNSEHLTIKDKFDMIVDLLPHYKISPEFINDTFKIPVVEREVPIGVGFATAENKSKAAEVIKDVYNMYQKKHAKGCGCVDCA